MSFTIILKEHTSKFPQASVAVEFTVVFPFANAVPLGSTDVTIGLRVRLVLSIASLSTDKNVNHI